jgi:DNA-binding SARP family transcriptional activator
MGVEDDGEPISIGGPRQRRLLALLVARSDTVVSNDWLAENLWRDEERPEAIAPAIRTYISRLRLAMPEVAHDWIGTEPSGYRWVGPAEAVEHRWFARMRADATEARDRDDPATAHRLLSRALTAWRGGPFRELEDLAWARAEIEQLRLDRLEMQEERWDAALALGRHTQITGELAAFTAEHGLRDRATRQYALALHRSGRTAEALRVLDTHRRRLADESALDEVAVAAIDAMASRSLLDVGVTDGTIEALPDRGILVQADEADERSLAVGDELAVDFPGGGSEQLVVAAIFEDNPLDVRWIVDLGVYERHVTSGHDDRVFLGFADGADPDAVEAAVLAVTGDYPAGSVLDPAEFGAGQTEQVDQLVAVINGMLGLTLFVAFLGVVNTIVLSVIERTREVGLLRAVGMSRRQVRGTIRWEAVIVCLFGAFLGIGLGVLFSAAAVAAIPDDVIGSVVVPYGTVAFVVLLAASAGILAAVLPARRAARLEVLDAIATNVG